MTKFVLLKGSHVEGEGDDARFYNASDPSANIVESDLDLDMMAPGKFEEYQEMRSRAEHRRKIKEEQQKLEEEERKYQEKLAKKRRQKEEDAESEEEEDDEDYGDDVSTEFEDADAAGATVYKKGKRYNVYNADGELVNDEPLTKKKAEKLLVEISSEDED